jgi:hypothetical protein
MEMQTLVNRVEELRDLADSMLEISKSEVGKKLNTNHYKGEKMALDSLLVWLKSNGIEPDTKEAK